MQKWKTDPKLFNVERTEDGKKKLDYETTYIKEFLSADPLRDWESIKGCKELWKFLLDKVSIDDNISVLDVGTKDGQFPEWLNDNGYNSYGIDVDPKYVDYAREKKRPVYYGNICDSDIKINTFDVVFNHHVLGLTPSITKAFQEILRICKRNGFVISLFHLPGNPKKHYSLINSVDELNCILNKCPTHDVIYGDYWKNNQEYVSILKKK